MRATLIGLGLAILAALLIVVIASGHSHPPEPVCPLHQTDTITVTPAVWVPETSTCPAGYENHDGQCRKWHDTSHWDYGTTCPAGYHYHNYGNMNERCHRNSHDTHPEHMAPLMNVWHVEGHWNYATPIYVPGYWIPPVCREPIVTHEQQVADDCQGWTVIEQEYIEGNPNGAAYIVASGAWADPYTLEIASASGTDPDGDAWSFPSISENEECLVVHCEQTVGPVSSATTWGGWTNNGDGTFTREGSYTDTWYDALDPQYVCSTRLVPVTETVSGSVGVDTEADCQGWSAVLYVYDPDQTLVDTDEASGLWADIYTLEQAQAFGETIYEPRECLVEHAVVAGLDVTCQGAVGWYALDGGEHVIYDDLVWLDEHTLEVGSLDAYDIALPWEGVFHIDALQVEEPEDCYVPCHLTPLYYMYVLQDYDAPAGYLQGGTCYVISAQGIPSVARQAAICTYPFCGTGWTYRADRIPFGDYVYRDCHGRIIYGWSAWDDSWLRDDFFVWGRDPDSPRLPCCEGTAASDFTAPSE